MALGLAAAINRFPASLQNVATDCLKLNLYLEAAAHYSLAGDLAGAHAVLMSAHQRLDSGLERTRALTQARTGSADPTSDGR